MESNKITECQEQNLKVDKIPEHYLKLDDDALREKIKVAKKTLGNKLYIMAHHYQKDEVVEFADVTGDSLYLSMEAAKNKSVEHIIFCGVHFMAETADILSESWQNVYLPDENAGCSMADMANRLDLEIAWAELTGKFGSSNIIPLTYVNSTAQIKAFVGENGGACITSTNAETIVKWALGQNKKILFLPDQHLGRNTAYNLGVELEQMAVWNHKNGKLILPSTDVEPLIILWDGYCAVHQQFTMKNIEKMRLEHPDVQIIVHPECNFEVVQNADFAGSTNKIIETVQNAPNGSKFAIGTDNNLVGRLQQKYKDEKEIYFLNFYSCSCATMNRIRLPHLAWNLDNILNGNYQQKIEVDKQTATSALKSLEKMFKIMQN
ncbi:MAG: quinolinate synthase NadA [Candidatus Ancillula sp.]|jgi:quinolinate synthase|nr:quinolinate synthase NadA [Candidatus Ancillula sp.]